MRECLESPTFKIGPDLGSDNNFWTKFGCPCLWALNVKVSYLGCSSILKVADLSSHLSLASTQMSNRCTQREFHYIVFPIEEPTDAPIALPTMPQVLCVIIVFMSAMTSVVHDQPEGSITCHIVRNIALGKEKDKQSRNRRKRNL